MPPKKRKGRGRSRTPSRARKLSRRVQRMAKKKVPAKGPRKVPAKGPRKDPRKVPAPPKLISRPARWWREPIPEDKNLSADERDLLVAQERLYRTEVIKQKIRDLRAVSTEFDSDDGYPLDTSKLIRIPANKLRKLESAHRRLQQIKARPAAVIGASTEKQKKKLRRKGLVVLPGQKKFFLHHDSNYEVEASWEGGEIKTFYQLKEGEVEYIEYEFIPKPRTWEQVKERTREIMRRGMKRGTYRLVTSLYGSIGMPVAVGKLEESLDDFFGQYHDYMAQFVTGWRWTSVLSYKGVIKATQRRSTTEERFKAARKARQKKERDLIKSRLRGRK
jgi:hypothetical protein